jgi:hypothetical protein
MLPVQAYLYRDSAVGRGADTVVCVIDRQLLENYLGTGQVKGLFGGCAEYTTSAGQDFVGVWGARNASRFRRFLRERGAAVVVRNGRPPGVRLRYASSRPGQRPQIRTLGEPT